MHDSRRLGPGRWLCGELKRNTRCQLRLSLVVADVEGRLLLAKRTDNELWTIPGGGMEPGETIAATAIREVKEETGIAVEVVSLIGIYSNPQHVVEPRWPLR